MIPPECCSFVIAFDDDLSVANAALDLGAGHLMPRSCSIFFNPSDDGKYGITIDECGFAADADVDVTAVAAAAAAAAAAADDDNADKILL